MINNKNFDVIIIGGSYSGLSAALALGRALKNVLIIDSGKPCNSQTPHSHNFITRDGETPSTITTKAKAQVLKYDTVKFFNGLATSGKKTGNGFEIKTKNGDIFTAEKLLFATGITDLMPNIKGFSACWGITILHCPYCHGYEVKHQPIGIIGNGDWVFEFCKLINNWTKKLTLFTNGASTLTPEQTEKIKSHNIEIIEDEIAAFEHTAGNIECIRFNNNTKKNISAIFTKAEFKQHCDIPQSMGCELTTQGLLKINDAHQTSVPGIYAAGDNTTTFRTVSGAVAAGTKAGTRINKELIETHF